MSIAFATAARVGADAARAQSCGCWVTPGTSLGNRGSSTGWTLGQAMTEAEAGSNSRAGRAVVDWSASLPVTDRIVFEADGLLPERHRRRHGRRLRVKSCPDRAFAGAMCFRAAAGRHRAAGFEIDAASSQGAYGVKKHLLALDRGLVSIGRMRPRCMEGGK